jgi:hypothetical protein
MHSSGDTYYDQLEQSYPLAELPAGISLSTNLTVVSSTTLTSTRSKSVDGHLLAARTLVCIKCNVRFPSQTLCSTHRCQLVQTADTTSGSSVQQQLLEEEDKVKDEMEVRNSAACTMCHQQFETRKLWSRHTCALSDEEWFTRVAGFTE